jgi:hypothetical protein
VPVEEPQPVARLPIVKSRLLALAAASMVGLALAVHGSAQPGTTAPPPVASIKVTFTDSRINMSPKRAQRGSVAQFILLNRGTKPHTFKLGHERRGTGTQTGFTKALKPGEQSVHIYFLDYRGKLPYLGSLPADRSKPGMKGFFTIF